MREPLARHLTVDAERVLSGWTTDDPVQARLREDYLAQLRAHPDAVLREGPPEHLTVGCLVLDESRGRVLLTLHAKAQRWFQLGGHLEPGDAGLRDAALRETVEESGLPPEAVTLSAEPVHLDRHALGGAFGGCREHLDVRYAAVTRADAAPVASAESLDLAWWPVDALPADTRDEIGPLVTAALSRLG